MNSTHGVLEREDIIVSRRKARHCWLEKEQHRAPMKKQLLVCSFDENHEHFSPKL